jgi:hypothetical protein
MDTTILIATGCLEIGLFVGYSMSWINDGRRMIYGMVQAALSNRAKGL